MSTTSIADLNLEAEPEKITPETGAKALSTNVAAGADVQAEITPSDLRLPRINLVQRQSNEELIDAFDFGDIVLNKTTLIAPAGTAVDGVIVAKIKKQYQEKLPWDPSRAIQPKVFDTAKQVRESGGSVVYGDDHFYEPIAHILLIIPATEMVTGDALDELFYYEFEDQKYTRALFTAGGTGYNTTARNILDAAESPALKSKGIRYAKWKMTSGKKANAKNSWFGLTIARSGSNTDELVTWTLTVAP